MLCSTAGLGKREPADGGEEPRLYAVSEVEKAGGFYFISIPV